MNLFLLAFKLTVILLGSCHCKVDDADNPLIFTVATHPKDGYKRFIRSAEYYNMKVITLGMEEARKDGYRYGNGYKVNLLKKALAPYAEESKDRLVLFVDSYDVMFQSEWKVIEEKFKESNAKILFGAENTDYCWPDPSLTSKYPPVDGGGQKHLNSGLFIGYVKNIWKLINYQPIENTDEDQLFYMLAYLDEKFRVENSFKLDHKSNLFQNLLLSVDDVSLDIDNEGVSKLINNKYGTHPAIVHGNAHSKQALDHFGNYLAGAFIDGKCKICDKDLMQEDLIETFSVLVAIFIETPTPFLEEFLDKILRLNFNKKMILLFVHNAVEYHAKTVDLFIEYARKEEYLSVKSVTYSDNVKEVDARELSVENCLKNNCDYLFVVDSDSHIDNRDTLRKLIYFNKDVISPTMSRFESVRANFWGAVDEKGFYARSSDYLNIVNNDIKGIWNVPHITGCYLVRSKLVHFLKYRHAELDPDMAMTLNFRKWGVFMFTVNLVPFGHLVSTDNFDIEKTRPEVENKFDWEKRLTREDL